MAKQILGTDVDIIEHIGRTTMKVVLVFFAVFVVAMLVAFAMS